MEQEVKDEAQSLMHEHKRPEPPKDENGNPIKPPEGMRPPFGRPPVDGNFPEPPKDENGNPVKPPEGMRPPFGRPPVDGNFPEPPKDENGNPVKPPEGMRPPFDHKKPGENETGSET